MAKFGNSWLGQDTLSHYVESPRRYGFHATLKAPMRLKPDVTFSQFYLEVEQLSKKLRPVELGTLKLKRIGDFLALTTDDKYHKAILEMAFSCTTHLDHLRAELNEAERKKRKNLNADEMLNLEKWGYPYVGDHFRFHMTMTSTLSQDDQAKVIEILSPKIPNERITVDSISIFGDPGLSRPFEFVERFELKGSTVL